MTIRKTCLIALAALSAAACSGDKDDDRAERRRDRDRETSAEASPSPDADGQAPTVFGAQQPGNQPQQVFQQQQPAFRPDAPRGQPAALPSGTWRMVVTPIPGPDANIPVSSRILIPAGWTTQGGAFWETNLDCEEPAGFRWAATSPDGHSNFQIFPMRHWTSTPLRYKPGCEVRPYRSVRDYLEDMLRQGAPGARVTGVRPRPDLPNEGIRRSYQMLQQNPNGGRHVLDSIELRFEHTLNGVTYEGVMLAYGTGSFGTPYQAYYNGPMVHGFTGNVVFLVTARAPKGQLDMNLIEAMHRSARIDPAFQIAYSNVQVQQGAMRADAARQRLAQYQAQIEANRQAEARSRSGQAGFAAYAGADSTSDNGMHGDRAQRERLESINEVETYDDPVYGGRVQLSSHYDHVHRVTNADAYILTNDPNLNLGQYGIEAQKLNKAP